MASGNFIPYNNFNKAIYDGTINFMGGNVQALLLSNNYIPDVSGHVHVSDIASYEVPGTGGYVRQNLSNPSVTLLPNGNTKITTDNISFGDNVTITARYLVLAYTALPSAADQPLMFYVDLNSGGSVAVQSLNSSFAIDISADGIYQIQPVL